VRAERKKKVDHVFVSASFFLGVEIKGSQLLILNRGTIESKAVPQIQYHV
jgi:hypothetical protein